MVAKLTHAMPSARGLGLPCSSAIMQSHSATHKKISKSSHQNQEKSEHRENFKDLRYIFSEPEKIFMGTVRSTSNKWGTEHVPLLEMWGILSENWSVILRKNTADFVYQ